MRACVHACVLAWVHRCTGACTHAHACLHGRMHACVRACDCGLSAFILGHTANQHRQRHPRASAACTAAAWSSLAMLPSSPSHRAACGSSIPLGPRIRGLGASQVSQPLLLAVDLRLLFVWQGAPGCSSKLQPPGRGVSSGAEVLYSPSPTRQLGDSYWWQGGSKQGKSQQPLLLSAPLEGLEHLLQVTRLVHGHEDVRAADELALHKHLRTRGHRNGG